MFKIAMPVICLFFVLAAQTHASEHIRLCNHTGRDICEFYISAHNETDWGDDTLEDQEECLNPSKCVNTEWQDTWTNVQYDLRWVYRDKSHTIAKNVKLKWSHDGITTINLYP